MRIRRLVCGVGACVLALGIVPASAEGLQVGVEAGINASYLTIPKDADVTRKVGAGLLAGAFVVVPLADTVKLQAEVLYIQRHSAAAVLGGTHTNDINVDYITIPVLAKLALFKGLYAVEGVAFHFPLKAEIDGTDIKTSTRTDVSIVLGAGKMVSRRFGVEGRWNTGLRRVNSVLDTRNRSIVGLLTVSLR